MSAPADFAISGVRPPPPCFEQKFGNPGGFLPRTGVYLKLFLQLFHLNPRENPQVFPIQTPDSRRVVSHRKVQMPGLLQNVACRDVCYSRGRVDIIPPSPVRPAAMHEPMRRACFPNGWMARSCRIGDRGSMMHTRARMMPRLCAQRWRTAMR